MSHEAKFHLLLIGVSVFSQFVAYSADRSQWLLCDVFLIGLSCCGACIDRLVSQLLKESSDV